MTKEIIFRLSAFFGVLFLMMLWEFLAPRRSRMLTRRKRWTANLGLVLVDTLVIRAIFPAAAVGMAVLASEQRWGFFHYWQAPYWLAVIACVIALDLVIYLQHVMFHAIPIFWRVHRVHHVDLDIDVTTGVRFHPIEIFLSLLIKFAAITLLGAPILAVILFQVTLNATSMFNHGNVYMPLWLDKIVRWIIVSPDMHRVHHSVLPNETNSNFGFNFPWWDRLFGTYRAQPKAGHLDMTIGINNIRDERLCAKLIGMLALPFTTKVEGYAINRRRDE